MIDPDPSRDATRRRRVLAGLATVSLAGVAGCSRVTGTTTTLEMETEQPDQFVNVLFTDGEDIRFSLKLGRDYARDDPRRYYPFRIVTANYADLELKSLELVFRAPSAPVRSLHLRELSEQKANIVEFYRDGERTVLSMPNPGQVPAFAESSHQFQFVLESTDTVTLSIDTEASLSNGARFEDTYVARGQFDVAFP